MSSEIDLEELKRLAQAATPGGWFVGRVFRKCTRDHGARGHGGPDCVYEEFARDATYEENGTEICSDAGDEVVGSGVEGAHVSEPNARYIAAANPAAVLALIERVEEAEHSREFMKEWYACRLERLKQMAKERGFWPEMAAIIANGTATPSEPDNYTRLLQLAKFRAEDAEKKSAALLERVSRLEALARKGLEAYHHGEACPFAFSTRPGNPAECEHEACREWAAALEGTK